MGDFRATIKLQMEMFDKKYEHEMWINYTPNDEGCDQRIIDCFAGWYREARADFEETQWEAERKYREQKQEEDERAELARLKAKYDTNEEKG